jgi:hypothetical protein
MTVKIRVICADNRAAHAFAHSLGLGLPYTINGAEVDVELLPPFDDELGAADVVHEGQGDKRRLADGVITWQWLERPPSSTDIMYWWMFGGQNE